MTIMEPHLPVAYGVRDIAAKIPSRLTILVISVWLAILATDVGPPHVLTDLTPWFPQLWQVVFYTTAGFALLWAVYPTRLAANGTFVLFVVAGVARSLSALLLLEEPRYVIFAGWALIVTLWWEVWPSLVLDTLREKYTRRGE